MVLHVQPALNMLYLPFNKTALPFHIVTKFVAFFSEVHCNQCKNAVIFRGSCRISSATLAESAGQRCIDIFVLRFIFQAVDEEPGCICCCLTIYLFIIFSFQVAGMHLFYHHDAFLSCSMFSDLRTLSFVSRAVLLLLGIWKNVKWVRISLTCLKAAS